ncbi:MAG: hypothetical protein IJO40_00250 [Thermoguttaceae bacterium]|nr:hypothetical protein [Thermoguttaceae bacterium]
MFRTVKIVFRWCVFLAFLATVVVAGIAYRRADAEIRRVVQTELQRKFPKLDVSFESIRFDSTRGVRILSVAWRAPDAPPEAPPLLEAEEIYVEIPIDWNALKSGDLSPRRIAIARPQMRTDANRAAFAQDLLRLKPTPSEKPCPVEAFDGAIFFDDPERPNETTTLAGLRLRLTPTPRSAFADEPPPSPEKILGDARFFADDANDANDVNNANDASVASVANDVNNANNANDVNNANDADDANAPISSNDASPVDADETVWTLTLSASNPYVQALNVRGCVAGSRWAFRGAARQLDVAPVLQRLDAERRGKLGSLRNARGQTSLDFEVAADSTAPDGVRFRVDGELSGGAVASPLLKFPLSDVEIRYTATQDSLEIERFSARSGATTLAASYRQVGPISSPNEGALRLRLNDYPLDDAHLKRLAIENAAQANVESEKLRKLVDFLNDYQFSATTNVDLTVEKSARQGGSWRPTNLVISGSGLDLVCVAFPYRLEQLSGRVALDAAGALTLALRSEFNERSLKIDGRFDDALGTPSGAVEIEGLGYPIDARLLSALPATSRAELARLRPSGAIDANVKIDYNPNRAERLQVKTTIGVRDAAIQYDLFPLPISSIGGLIQMEKGAWVFSNLSGKSGAARLRASGSFVSGAALADTNNANNANDANDASALNNANKLNDAVSPAVARRSVYSNASIRPASANAPLPKNAPRGADFADFVPPVSPALVDSIPTPPGAPLPPDAWRFELTTDVEDFPLGEELSNALVRYDGRDSFEKLGLSGKANGQIRVAYRSDQRKLDVEFDAEPVAGAASMKPTSLPYELGDLQGRAFYRAGEFRVDGFRARSGRTTYSANLLGRFAPNAGWTFDVSALRVERLQLDRDLLSAAPPAAVAFVDYFQPNGFFNVDGAARLERDARPNSRVRVAWDLRFVAQQNSFRPNGVPLDNVCGRIKTRGFAVAGGPVAVGGEFDLDSFCWGDLLVSRTIGPFYFDGTDVFWGRDAPPVRRSTLYQHPFLRERIDADPLYRVVGVAARNAVYRGQTPNAFASDAVAASDDDAPPGFAPDASTQTQTSTPRPRIAVPTAPPGLLSNSASNAATLGSGDAASFTDSQPVATVSAADERRPIQARVFDGQATTDGVFYRRQDPTYKVVFNVKNARLADVTREFAPGSKPIQGRVAAYATLRGEGLNVATLKGEGGFSLQDAELYESPQIVKILQILSVREPDQTAFDSAFVDFEVIGDRLQLKRVLLEGNALTLFGDGWLTVRDKEKLIDLTLNARLGSASDQIPIVSDFLGGVGDQLAQIRVEGALSSPIVRQERFSGVKKAWWNVFPEQEPTPTDAVPTERPKPLRDAIRRLTSGGDKNDEK